MLLFLSGVSTPAYHLIPRIRERMEFQILIPLNQQACDSSMCHLLEAKPRNETIHFWIEKNRPEGNRDELENSAPLDPD